MKKRTKLTTTKKETTKNTLWTQVYNWVEKYRWLLLILALTAILRIPTLFEPNRYADEDIYLTLGMAVRRGLVLYRDIHDNKPPLLYLVAALAGSVTYFRLILLGWNLVNITLIWQLSKRFLKRESIIVFVTAFFAFFSSIPLTEGNIANGEIFMIMPTTAAVLVLLIAKAKKKLTIPLYFLAGVLFAVAFLFKVPVAAEVGMIGIWLVLSFWEGKKTNWKQLLTSCIALIVGFVVPIVFTVVYYYLKDAGDAYVKAALLQNVGYVSSWEGGTKKPFYESGLVQRGLVLLGSLSILTVLRKKLGSNYFLLSLWFLGALFGALLSGRPYPHYMIEILPPLSLMLGVAVTGGILQIIFAAILVGLMLFSLKYYDFWHYDSWPYYQNFLMYKLGYKTENDYLKFWGDGVVRNQTVGRYIAERTSKDDRIFVWGTEPAIYDIANRLPVGRYTVSYHVSDFHAFDETIATIRKVKPKYIVFMTNEGTKFPKLVDYINSTMILVKQVGEAQVYMAL